MDDLIARIRAAIDDHGLAANQCVEKNWRVDGANSCQVYVRREDYSSRTIAWCGNGYEDDFSNVIHIAANDPARVLRQVAAHRKILDDCQKSYRSQLDAIPADEAERWHRTGQGYVWFKVVKLLAEAYEVDVFSREHPNGWTDAATTMEP